jgi:hypothetical protein
LYKLGYIVTETGSSQRILPHAITQHLTTSPSGALVAATEGSTRPATVRITRRSFNTNCGCPDAAHEFRNWNTTNVHFCTLVPERFPAFRLMYSAGQMAWGSAMPHRNAPNLDSSHNTAIRAEIGERLRVLLSKEQPSPPPRVQHLLDCLSASDATMGRTHEQR